MTATATPIPDTPNAAPTDIEQDVERILAGGVTLAGRHFRAMGAETFEHDAYLIAALEDSKLLSKMQHFDPLHDELDNLTKAMIAQCYNTGTLHRILAGVLVEDGTTWSPAAAARTAQLLAAVSDRAERAAVWEIFSILMLNFFLNVDGSWRVFRSYSTSSAPPSNGDPLPSQQPPRAPGPTGAGDPPRDLSDSILASAAPPSTTTASGTSSSVPSPATTSTATPPSPAGQSARD